ncbi:hypothetical protein CEXT_470791 [Caerostris extrusa]|uniref:Uncharacterized protein n=1 Tax=Caerostris extrusa TaxID=172846 RepID=A0AAV4WVM9_CAEEX|nr:hypothetical protein CEXT_470791 [Caerostris extrusa]
MSCKKLFSGHIKSIGQDCLKVSTSEDEIQESEEIDESVCLATLELTTDSEIEELIKEDIQESVIEDEFRESSEEEIEKSKEIEENK